LPMNKIIPSLEQVRSEVSSIFIDDNLDFYYIVDLLKYHLDDQNPDNDPSITYELVLQKYRQHIEAWNIRNGEKERRGFVDKNQLKKRKNFLEFLNGRMYQIDWGNSNASPQRDDYLFGTLLSRTELLEQLKDFKRIWQKESKRKG
jgi:hypothetical protein